MEISQSRIPIFIFFFSVICLAVFPNSSHSANLVVDGVTQWKDPTVNIGDSIIFRHEDNYILYIFRNELAFNVCNFTQATPLTSLNSSSYTWSPSRLGKFYFSFSNGTEIPCRNGQKLAIKVLKTAAPDISIEPPVSLPVIVSEPPTPGGVVSSSPAFPWPFQPREKSSGPGGSPAPTTAMAPLVPGENGGSMPFIDSNPAVPLPTGEVDSATIRPLPTSADNSHALRQVQVEGFLGLDLEEPIHIHGNTNTCLNYGSQQWSQISIKASPSSYLTAAPTAMPPTKDLRDGFCAKILKYQMVKRVIRETEKASFKYDDDDNND
ncbi:hypothetical protein V2J09_007361 [Rumex salicifolius]